MCIRDRFAFNASFWGKLSSNEKALITAASMEEHAAQYEETCAKNGEYLAKLINEHGTKVRSFNDEFGTLLVRQQLKFLKKQEIILHLQKR